MARRGEAFATYKQLDAGNLKTPLSDPFWEELRRKQKPFVRQEFSESQERDMQRMMRVVQDMQKYSRGNVGEIDWDAELARFDKLPWPDYYLYPFHSVPGGWLSREAALNNRPAMQSIYVDCHPHACMGMYGELVKYIPSDAKAIVDVGAGIGDGAAIAAQQLPDSKVIALDCSQFMIIVGEKLHAGISNLEFKHALAEDTGLPADSVDCVVITLVFHECSDEGKADIAREAYRILRPGGTLVLHDTPPTNLMTYRGFFEPHKIAWTRFNPDEFIAKMGYVDIQEACVTDPPPRGFQVRPTQESLFTRVAKKPASRL